MRVFSRAMLAVAAAGVPLTLVGLFPGQAAAAPDRAAAVRPAGTGFSTAGSLAGVAAASKGSAWAVGYAGGSLSEKVLMLHWNGSNWSRVTTPAVLTAPGALSAVTVVSAKDAWAVGFSGGLEHPHSLILHWNGAAWSQVTSPAPVAGGALTAVSVSAKGGWAVGSRSTGPTVPDTSPLIFRLTGGTWSRVDPGFGAHSGVALDGVATTSAGITFSTGLYTGMITGVLARWNGHAWTWVKSFPEQGTYHWLNGIAAGPQRTAFALGINTSASLGVISIRWTGHSWVKAPAPAAAEPYAVTFAPGGAAWAAGSLVARNHVHTLVMRWNGHAWARVTSPATAAQLNGLAFATAGYGWAVGRTSPATASFRTLILHWNGRSWH